MNSIQQTIYLDKETKEALRLKAYQENKSQNKIIKEALKKELNIQK
jgi:predicted HicB family RNase H-like nuclease